MRIAVRTYTSLFALLIATSCVASTALASTGGSTAPGAPATPAAHPHGRAIATWFGPGFYGKQTACGQTLTPVVIGVANRKLPCGTLVQVSYRGHSLTVPVLDRGPYANNAQWDLTAGAAQALGVTETVRISTLIVGKATNSPSLGLPPTAPSAALAGGAAAAG